MPRRCNIGSGDDQRRPSSGGDRGKRAVLSSPAAHHSAARQRAVQHAAIASWASSADHSVPQRLDSRRVASASPSVADLLVLVAVPGLYDAAGRTLSV